MKSTAKTSNLGFEGEIFVQIHVYTGSRTLRAMAENKIFVETLLRSKKKGRKAIKKWVKMGQTPILWSHINVKFLV